MTDVPKPPPPPPPPKWATYIPSRVAGKHKVHAKRGLRGGKSAEAL